MATTLHQTHPLLAVTVNNHTDFITLATHCEKLADTLLECNHTQLQQALSERLTTCLQILRPTLLDPVPDNLISALTVEQPPQQKPEFAPGSEQLCDYALVLSQLITHQALTPEMLPSLRGLLADLVQLFSGQLTAPRWVNTENGVQFIEQ